MKSIIIQKKKKKNKKYNNNTTSQATITNHDRIEKHREREKQQKVA